MSFYIDNKDFWAAAAARCLRTMAQCALTYIGTATMLHEVDWLGVISSAAMGGILSILMAVATGLPEVREK